MYILKLWIKTCSSKIQLKVGEKQLTVKKL